MVITTRPELTDEEREELHQKFLRTVHKYIKKYGGTNEEAKTTKESTVINNNS